MNKKPSILIIYTGGTIGMMEDPETSQLKPFDFTHLSKQVPELNKFNLDLSSVSFEKPIDSSDMNPQIWGKMAKIIEENYDKHDGFVILHGSDTMAYSASALSFMLENLSKPVILTGSQLPIGMIRTDGKENLITAIEIAAAKENGRPVVPEVAIYFEYQLYRGNRTHKFNADHFEAFQSANYPVLAEAGVHINYNTNAIMQAAEQKLSVHYEMDPAIAILKIFPGISSGVINAIFNIQGIKAVIIETFGSGNAPINSSFFETIKEAVAKDIIVLNVTQCNSGRVEQGKYEASSYFNSLGVVGGADITTEAAVTKLMFLLGKKLPTKETKQLLEKSLRGEVTCEPV